MTYKDKPRGLKEWCNSFSKWLVRQLQQGKVLLWGISTFFLNQYSTIHEMLNICMLQKGILRDNLRMLLESQVLKHMLLCKYAM